MSGSELPVGDLDRQWYLLQGKDISGPYSGHAITDMVRERTIMSDARVATVGAREWQPLGVLTERVATVGPMPAPSPAPSSAERPRYAGFWIRVGAYVLDAVIVNICVFILSFVVFFALGVVFAAKTGSGDMLNHWIAGNKIWLNVVGIAVWIIYETAFVGGPWQATPGKRICGVHVVRSSGARLGYGRALGRYLCYFIDSILLLVGFMMVGWTNEKTALHDLICDTRVVYGKSQPNARAVAGAF